VPAVARKAYRIYVEWLADSDSGRPLLAVLGLVIHRLFWLFVVALVLFLATGAFGWLRGWINH
jgi:hypothetical protein